MTEETRLQDYLSVWDQTIGCDNCGKAWWMEDATGDETLFHDKDCPLFGNREAHAETYNLEYMEKELGRRVGVSADTREGWRDLAALYIRLHKDEQEDHFSSLYNLFELLEGEKDQEEKEAWFDGDLEKKLAMIREQIEKLQGKSPTEKVDS